MGVKLWTWVKKRPGWAIWVIVLAVPTILGALGIAVPIELGLRVGELFGLYLIYKLCRFIARRVNHAKN